MIAAERVLDALGDPTRRRVFDRVRRGRHLVRDIAEGMNVSRPAVSQHLKVLKTAGLVRVRIEGSRRLYMVDTRGIALLRDWLDGFWSETLAAFAEAAEREAIREREGR
jgi:DNA-binding transcriptional ArsR family regulator